MDTTNNNNQSEETVIAKFAPKLHYHPDDPEQHPTNPEQYYEYCHTTSKHYNKSDLSNAKLHKDIPRNTQDDSTYPVFTNIVYNEAQDKMVVQYWNFYDINYPPSGLQKLIATLADKMPTKIGELLKGISGLHTVDWEHTDIEFHKQKNGEWQPYIAVSFAHGKLREYKKLERSTEGPNVYVGYGGHGNYLSKSANILLEVRGQKQSTKTPEIIDKSKYQDHIFTKHKSVRKGDLLTNINFTEKSMMCYKDFETSQTMMYAPKNKTAKKLPLNVSNEYKTKIIDSLKNKNIHTSYNIFSILTQGIFDRFLNKILPANPLRKKEYKAKTATTQQEQTISANVNKTTKKETIINQTPPPKIPD